MSKIAALEKFLPMAQKALPYIGGTAAVGTGLYGLDKWLEPEPEPTMWEKITGAVSDIGSQVLPSVVDMSTDMARMALRDPRTAQALAQHFMPGAAQQYGQYSPQQYPQQYDTQPQMAYADPMAYPQYNPTMGQYATMDQMPANNAVDQTVNNLGFSEIEGLQNQLQSMGPYS